MNRLILGIALVLFSSTWVSAESSVWKAQKGKSVIFLGGTCHVLREKDYPLPKEFEIAYRASAVVVFETDLGTLHDPATQRKMLAEAMYADGSTIDKHLSDRTYRELVAYCEANDIPLRLLNRFRPSMLMVTLAIMELSKLGVSRQGVDQYFYDLAMSDGKVVEGLETADEQIHNIVTMADGREDEFVAYSLSDMRSLTEQFESLVNAWRAGDTVTLDRIMIDDLKGRWPALYKKLIVDRNRNWLSLIDSYQKTPGIEFILVGVGHLVGPDGIVEVLRNKGYKVEKL